LDGLEEFTFGLDGRRDDDFGFLKFSDGFSADVSHARCDSADKILRAVVDRRGTEENLAE
jgi:hypothetical protein